MIEATNIVILIQIPIILCIIIIGFQATRILYLKSFVYLNIGWIFNLLYISSHLIVPKLQPHNKLELWLETLFDSISMVFFLLATVRSAETPLLRKIKDIPSWAFILIIALAGIIKAFTPLGPTKLFPTIDVYGLPMAIVDFGALLSLANYVRNLTKPYPDAFLFSVGAFIYAIIQLFGIVKLGDEIFIFAYTSIENIGFFLGLIAKFFMLVGLSTLVINIVKELSKKESEFDNRKAFGEKLNIILGRTFHEITPPMQEMETLTNALIYGEGDAANEYALSKKARRELEKVEMAIQRMQTILSASIKMYNSDVVNSDFLAEKYDLPIPIDEDLGIHNINTLLEIAIMNFKSTVIKLGKDIFATNHIKFHTEYGANCNITCNSVQMVQVFYNIFKNAFEAVEKSKEICHLFIKTRNTEEKLEGEETSRIRKICVEIEDSGPGIPQALFEKIFEQGFSTKIGNVRGRGYGLEIVKTYTGLNNGFVTVESPVKEKHLVDKANHPGTKFIFYFPKGKINNVN